MNKYIEFSDFGQKFAHLHKSYSKKFIGIQLHYIPKIAKFFKMNKSSDLRRCEELFSVRLIPQPENCQSISVSE